ncbi:signal transducing adapter molecule 2-like [Sitodiplosis mosellana]|uniref:signal transducing adapter molecule 2-like n=1 Tax=Sitodiplosis mosellana TaxID=263140 RepID=UPI0024446310|nr:signal transducing adapter molecule 2-like [Sitodiplosis mosellana]
MKIDRLLHLLHDANPEDPSQDSQEMYILESHVNQMLPLIDNELERVDRNYAKLTKLSTQLVEAINMYHTLMRESDMQAQYASFRQQSGPIFSNNGMYNPYSQHVIPSLPNIIQNQQNQAVQHDNTQHLQQIQPQYHQPVLHNVHVSHMGSYYGVAPPGSTFNNQHTAPHSVLINQDPNTVMTTQVQQGVQQSDIMYQQR